jgi:uncharacterized membrane protein YhiD involved in acid resistance
MTFVGATLVVMSSLHLSGTLPEGSDPFDPVNAGISEGVIALVLFLGAGALRGGSRNCRGIALASTGFAILGFLVGLNFTIRGAGAFDIAYHLTVLPLLVLTASALLRMPRRA